VTMQPWRLLDTGQRPAAENMCLDEAVLTARSKGVVPNTLRFLEFRPSCVVVGYHQDPALEIRADFCCQAAIEVNRRITGGGAIYFGEGVLGWEIIADKGFGPRDVLSLYRKLCGATVEGLHILGVDASFRPVNDIEVEGRKISGTGGTEVGGAFLFQGTLLVDLDIGIMLRALKVPAEKLRDKEIDSLMERLTCLKRELGFAPPMDVIKAAIVKGFESTLDAEFVADGLAPWEEQYLEQHIERFRSPEWVYKISRSGDHDRLLHSTYKAPGGLIRVSAQVDDVRNTIEAIVITGDFFAYPKRAIYDLEARLKRCRCDKIEAVVSDFFSDDEPTIPGVTPDDFVAAIHAALAKRDLSLLGLSRKQANEVSMVCNPLGKLALSNALLVPYCAKSIECELRYSKECTSCGGCTVGAAYEMARNHGMEPITITSFEDLQKTLHDLKKRGTECFIGCCCDPFFVKHHEDFLDAGIPGLLINTDNASCYELDQEAEAKGGKFTGETRIKLDILEKIMCNRH
jgi:lipoate-protein ligase A